ncbi:MAG: hypothetical protein PVH45_00530 [Candidatus Omnitrophota bacterium]
MGERLEKYKERCRKFWGACLLAGRTKKQEGENKSRVPPKRTLKGGVAIILWSLIVIGIAYFAVLAGRHFWVKTIQPIWLEDRAVGR